MTDQARPADKIHIRDLRLQCIIGLREEEREAKQEVIVNVTLEADLTDAGQGDRIEQTVDYARIAEEVTALVAGSRFFLLERLAEAIAELCLTEPGVQRVRVCVEKPGALPAARAAAVEIVRPR